MLLVSVLFYRNQSYAVWLIEPFWLINRLPFCLFLKVFFSFLPFVRHLPDFKQRIAGQSLPFEDFAIHKANRYFEQNGRLFLPGVVSYYMRFTQRKYLRKTLPIITGRNSKNP